MKNFHHKNKSSCLGGRAKEILFAIDTEAGNSHVSETYEVSTMATHALSQQWYEPISFNHLVKELDAAITLERGNADLISHWKLWKKIVLSKFLNNILAVILSENLRMAAFFIFSKYSPF